VNLLREEFTVDVSGLYVRAETIHQYAERELKLRLHVQAPPTEPSPEAVAPPTEATAPVDETALPPSEPEAPPSPATPEEVGAIVIPRPELPPPEMRGTSEGRRTMAIQRTLRSGTRIQFDGDVTIWGDVNPGAQIVAHGNVLVLGALRGMVHAGAAGDEASFVLAFQLQPTQLRIGRRIAMLPERADSNAPFAPELARVVDGNVQIERFSGRMPR
jgi:septum site-determining protein MinC